MRIVDGAASLIADCPAVLTSMLGFDASVLSDDALNVQVQLALSMRRHGRGGILLVARPAARNGAIRSFNPSPMPSIQASRSRSSRRPWRRRPPMVGSDRTRHRRNRRAHGREQGDRRHLALRAAGVWREDARRRGAAVVEHIIVTEPEIKRTAERMHPGQLGGTRRLSAAQFVHDQRGAVALVASQDARSQSSPGPRATQPSTRIASRRCCCKSAALPDQVMSCTRSDDDHCMLLVLTQMATSSPAPLHRSCRCRARRAGRRHRLRCGCRASRPCASSSAARMACAYTEHEDAFDAELPGRDPATSVAVPARPGCRGACSRPRRCRPVSEGRLAVARSWSDALTASAGMVSVIGGPAARRDGAARLTR